MSELGDNSLFRFVKVLLQVGHEGVPPVPTAVGLVVLVWFWRLM